MAPHTAVVVCAEFHADKRAMPRKASTGIGQRTLDFLEDGHANLRQRANGDELFDREKVAAISDAC